LHWFDLLGVAVLVNSIPGPTMAHPALLEMGLPILIGNESDTATKRNNSEN
jgi:hypothetical protein